MALSPKRHSLGTGPLGILVQLGLRSPSFTASKFCLCAPLRVLRAAFMPFAWLDSFTRGRILGVKDAGKREAIAKAVCKKDGSHPTLHAVDGVLQHFPSDPAWRGEDSRAGGRPLSLTPKQEKAVRRLVFRERGEAVVTTAFCKKRLESLRPFSDAVVRHSLHRAGLAWLPRRVKAAAPLKYKEDRLAFARWLLGRQRATLKRFAYTDGTTFYLARTVEENADKQRAGLGRYVWRICDGKDGLWDENIGPSCYAKGQGTVASLFFPTTDGSSSDDSVSRTWPRAR